MKFLRLRAFIFLLLISGCANVYANNFFAIIGSNTGVDSGRVYLDYLDDKNVHHTDSATVLRGSFRLMGAIETPTFAIFYFSSSHTQQSFFFDPGFTFVEGDTSMRNRLMFRGSSSTTLFSEYQQQADSFNRCRSKLEPFISGKKAVKDSAVHAQYMDDYYLSMKDEEDFTEQLIRKHADSYVSAYLLYYKFSGEGNINKGIALLSILAPKIQKSKYCQLLVQKQAALQSSVTGMRAPDFSEPDTSGKMVKLSDIKAQYILLDFWASWCGPCRRENPELLEAYNKFHTKGFEIVAVSFDQKKQPWLTAINKDGLSWPNLCSYKGWDDEAALLYHVSELPTNFLIDKNGIIVSKNLLGVGLEYELEKLLGK